jgi:hypothetical protein
MRSFLIIAALATWTGAARAEWKIDSFKDDMTDGVIKVASLETNGAKLLLQCPSLRGAGMYVTVELPSRLWQRRIYVTYRVDDGAVRHDDAIVGTALQSATIVGLTGPELKGKRRLRVEFLPTGGQRHFYDFNLTGVDKALQAMQCKAG